MSNKKYYISNIGAGVLPISLKTKRILIAFRSGYVDTPNTWSTWGGSIDIDEENENQPNKIALREFREETGYDGEIKLIPSYIHKTLNNFFTYYNFIGLLDDEFTPQLDWENDYYRWVTFNELLEIEPKHYGLNLLLKNEINTIKKYVTKDINENLDKVSKKLRLKFFINKVFKLYGINTYNLIGGGSFGLAYDIGDNKIMKITTDKTEAVNSKKIINKKNKYLSNIYDVKTVKFKFLGDEKKYYIIILEKLKTDNQIKYMFKRLKTFFRQNELPYSKEFIEFLDYYKVYKDNTTASKIYHEIYLYDKKLALFFNDLLGIITELHTYGIESDDFINTDNLGFKPDGKLGYFDIGFGNYFDDFNNTPEVIINY
jgi:8-oxo-dGTP pyrophosphatase MutT (NUDIX family)